MHLENQTEKSRLYPIGLLVMALLLTLHICFGASYVQAAKKNGFVTENGRTYYYENGVKHKGWLELNGKKYYFTSGQGVMITGWIQDTKGNKRFFNEKTGEMITGWVKYDNGKRYFNPKSGVMQTGWLTVGDKRYYFDARTGYAKTGFYTDESGNVRYFYQESCVMARGWLSNSKGERRFFYKAKSVAKDGIMATRFATIAKKTYYFYSGSGKMATGWVVNTAKGYKYYFNPSSGVMATGVVTINGVKYQFANDGILIGEYTGMPSTTTNGKKTIKNYLLGALMPVGKTLYVWGGAWTDSTRKGLSPAWEAFYNSQSSGYSYGSCSDRSKGMDCSGFVGWTAYQVMQKKSNVGSGYTVVSGEVGSYYNSRGWGNIINQNYLSSHNYVLKAGDIGFNSGHTWIVLGQCPDKSVVLVHSTPDAGVQIAGTSVPTTGAYNSQAAALAEKYMSKYPGFKKYKYYTAVGNYVRQYNFFRWNRTTLSDPDGYMNMTADKILKDLYGW